MLYLQNYKEFEAEILDLQSEKYGLSFDIKKYTTSGWALGDENVIDIRAFKFREIKLVIVAMFSSSPPVNMNMHAIWSAHSLITVFIEAEQIHHQAIATAILVSVKCVNTCM